MGYCFNCGKEVSDNAEYCMNCGVALSKPVGEDKGGFLWGLLGFFVPIVGLILFLIWKDQKPKTAKTAGIGALVNVIASFIFTFIYFIFIFVLTFSLTGFFNL